MRRLEMLVDVLDHHDRGVDHRADGDRDAAERHDVRVHALLVHHDERREHAERQRHDDDQRRTHVQQEQQAHEADDDELLGELVAQVRDGALDELRAVVRRDHDLDAFGQAAFNCSSFACTARIVASAFFPERSTMTPPATSPSPSAPRCRGASPGRPARRRRRAAGPTRRPRRPSGIARRVVDVAQIAARADHVLRLAQLDDGSAGFLVPALDRLDDGRVRMPYASSRSGRSTTWNCRTMPPTAATSATSGIDFSSYGGTSPAARAVRRDRVGRCGRRARIRRSSPRPVASGPSDAFAPGGRRDCTWFRYSSTRERAQ
jgi:hypothetical protein